MQADYTAPLKIQDSSECCTIMSPRTALTKDYEGPRNFYSTMILEGRHATGKKCLAALPPPGVCGRIASEPPWLTARSYVVETVHGLPERENHPSWLEQDVCLLPSHLMCFDDCLQLASAEHINM